METINRQIQVQLDSYVDHQFQCLIAERHYEPVQQKAAR